MGLLDWLHRLLDQVNCAKTYRCLCTPSVQKAETEVRADAAGAEDADVHHSEDESEAEDDAC